MSSPSSTSSDSTRLASSVRRLKLQGEPPALEDPTSPACPWWPPIVPPASGEEKSGLFDRARQGSFTACSDISHASDQSLGVFTHSPYTWAPQPASPGDDTDTSSATSDPAPGSHDTLRPPSGFRPDPPSPPFSHVPYSLGGPRYSPSRTAPMASSSTTRVYPPHPPPALPPMLCPRPIDLCLPAVPYYTPTACAVDASGQPTSSAVNPGCLPLFSLYEPESDPNSVLPAGALEQEFSSDDFFVNAGLALSGCGHRRPWKRLRAKRGFTFFACRECGVKWRVQHLVKAAVAKETTTAQG
eukprot:EG_transcript_8438